MSRARAALALPALLATTIALSSCGASTAAEADGSDLRIGVQSLPTTLDANASVSNAGIQIYYNIYDTLVMRDTKADGPEFIPGLAEEWNRLDDLTWQFKIREGVTFHDGTPMTAEDIAYSYNRVIDEEDASYGTARAYLFSNMDSVEAVDDTTLKITTIKPEPLMEHLLSDPNAGISSKAYVEEVGIDEAALSPVTTGPYEVSEWVPGDRLVLEAVDNHWSGEEAPFETITYTLMPEITSRITALSTGEVDMITNVPPDQEALLTADDVRVEGDALPLYHVYRLNMTNEITDDPKLRAAMSYAINREALTESLWEGKAEPAKSYQYDTYGEELQFPEREDIAYDPEQAKKLLEESDYAGETVQIYNTTDYYTHADQAALAIIDMWAEIGIKGELVEMDSIPDSENGNLEARTWSNPLYYNDPMGMIERHWAPEGEAAQLGHFVSDDEYAAAFEQARYSLDETERTAALEEIFDYYRDQTPFIYLYQPYEALAMSADIDYTQSTNLRPYQLSFRAGDISQTD